MSFIGKLLNLLYVPVCLSCHVRIKSGVLCSACLDMLRENVENELCPTCLLPYNECRCVSPLLKNAGIRRHYKLFRYDPQIPDAPESRILYTLKHKRLLPLGDFIEKEFKASLPMVKDTQSTVVTYMPRMRRSVFADGTDAAKVIARAVARASGLRCLSCFRHVGNRRQKELSVNERIINARNSYKLTVLPEDIVGKRVILVDDVSTTGATLAVGARLLRRAGARSVTVVTLAASHRSAYA